MPAPTCTHEVSPFHPPSCDLSLIGITALTWDGIVSVPACSKLHELVTNCPDSRPAPFTGARVFRWWGDFPQVIRPGGRPSSLAVVSIMGIGYKYGDGGLWVGFVEDIPQPVFQLTSMPFPQMADFAVDMVYEQVNLFCFPQHRVSNITIQDILLNMESHCLN